MTPTGPNGGTPQLVKSFNFPGFNVSWAGVGRRDIDFCFGSEDGNLLFTSADGHFFGGMKPAAPSSEAINGVAFIGDTIAVSTRREVTLCDAPPARRQRQEVKKAVFPGGAHGVIATSEGHFVAPLGQNGFMALKVAHGEAQPYTVIRAAKRDRYFYRVICLPPLERPGILVFAARHAGVVTANYTGETNRRGINSNGFPGLDIVDLCSLATASAPSSVAAVGRDCTLALFKDVQNSAPATMRFDDIKGIAYRLFSAGGHIIVLTSHAIYLLVDLARRFLSGEPVDRQPTYMRVRAIEAVDANLVDGHWLLTVTPDSVLRFDLNLVAGAQGEVGRFEEPREVGATSIQTRWEALPLMSSETEASLIPA